MMNLLHNVPELSDDRARSTAVSPVRHSLCRLFSAPSPMGAIEATIRYPRAIFLSLTYQSDVSR